MRLLILLALVAILFACGGDDAAPAETAPQATAQTTPRDSLPVRKNDYPTTKVTVRDVERPVRITGRVVPLQEATLSSQVPGLILPASKLLQEGKYYRRGETVVAIDDEQLRLGLRAERAELQAALIPLLSDLSIDYATDFPAWQAFTDGIRADNALPDMPTITNDQLRYFIASRGIPARYHGIRAKEALLDDYTVRAPFPGQLTRVTAEPGSYVNPGQPIAQLSRTDVYEVRAAVPAAAAAQLKTGAKIDLRSRNLDRDYRGTLHRFGAQLDEQTQTVTAFVRVSGPQLRSGLYLEGELPGEAITQVAVLPREALSRDNSVYVIRNGRVATQDVTVAAIDGEFVYLRGLTAGEVVITRPPNESIVGRTAK